MKKISKSNWERYKKSPEGQEVIALFNHLTTPEATVEDMLAVIKRFNQEFCRNTSKKEEQQELIVLTNFDNLVKQNLPKDEESLKNFKCGDFFVRLTHYLAVEDDNIDIFDAPQKGFKNILWCNTFLSVVLFANMPYSFLPNLYVMQFVYFKKFAEKYELELPDIPKRSDYRERWFYYLTICNIIDNFVIENNLEEPGEICAFLYDYEMTNIKEEMEIEHNRPMPNVPEQAWILVGNYGEGEKTMKSGFWQANELTSKGDIMLFYEKSPVKKLNSVWIALEDGVKDPFFHYYSHTYIGNKIEIPEDKAITFEDFKNSEYFKNRPKEGNFVSKNFQDVSGWNVSSEDFSEIKRMLDAKGFNTSVLPSLYEPKVMAGIEIIYEDDVSWKLLVPRLEEMGWKYKKDFFDEVEFPAGRGTTGHEMDKRPDFCLHLSGGERDKEAQVVIEVKLNMKNNQEIKANYDQGVSYAKWGNARVLVICDKNQIRVYERNKKNQFVPFDTPTARFRWEDMQKLEKFNELKGLLSKKYV